MKKILLASTILAGTAGFAAADNANFTFSGSAYVGVAVSMGIDEPAGVTYDRDLAFGETDVTIFVPEISASFTAGMMTTTDGGLEAGASIEVSAKGSSMEDDHTDGAFGTESFDTAGGISNATVYLSGEWGKVTATYDNDGTDVIDTLIMGGVVNGDYYDVVFAYDHSIGDFDVHAAVAVSPLGETNGDAELKGTYNFGDYSVWAMVQWDNDNVGTDAFGVDTGDYEVSFGGSASFNGLTVAAEAEYDAYVGIDDWDWKASVDYAMDAYSVGAWVEDDGTDDNLDYGVKAGYDLGGGVSVDAAYIYDNDLDVSLVKAGVSMSF